MSDLREVEVIGEQGKWKSGVCASCTGMGIRMFCVIGWCPCIGMGQLYSRVVQRGTCAWVTILVGFFICCLEFGFHGNHVCHWSTVAGGHTTIATMHEACW